MITLNDNRFSLVLRMCRENAGLTQKQIADALNIERSTYAYYESGMTQPSGTMIVKLAKIFNVDYQLFMEAVGDFDFRTQTEGSRYSTLNDPYWEDRERLSTLLPDEQNLILLYRSFTPEQKAELNNLIKKFKEDNTEQQKIKRQPNKSDLSKNKQK